MSHERITNLLDDYVDGRLAPELAREVEPHLEGCAICRDEVEALRSLLAETARLPRSIEPPRDLWSEVDSRIDHLDWRSRTLWSMRYPLAAAAVLLIASSTLITTLLVRSDDSTGVAAGPGGESAVQLVAQWQATETEYLRATAELSEALEASRGSLRPETAESIEDNLRVIDGAIQETRAALAADPANRDLMQMLSATYRKKLEVLRQVSRL